jgi:SAM-dependent methyltransferase
VSLDEDMYVKLFQCPSCRCPLVRATTTLRCPTCSVTGAILKSNLVSFGETADAQTKSILGWPLSIVKDVESSLLALGSRTPFGGGVLPTGAIPLLTSLGLISSDGRLTPLGSWLEYNSSEYVWQSAYDVLEGYIDAKQINEQARILDIGCGAGQTLRRLDLPPGCLVVGVDNKLQGLAYGSLFFSLESSPVVLCGASAYDLPLIDKSFDVIICRGPINYCHQSRMLKEAVRVLRPGGWMFCRTERVWWDLNVLSRQVKSPLLELFNLRNLWWGLVHEVTGYQIEPGGIVRGSRAFCSERRLRRILEPLGCQILRYEGSRQGPQYRGHGTQAKVLCVRISDAK